MALHDDFEGIDLERIRRYITTHQEEHLTLDFKRVTSTDLADSNDQRNFARALSGFANADGGLIVWGVGTSKRGGVDVAAAECPIPDVIAFVGRLNEFTGSLANPRVDGVRHRKVEADDSGGFAVSLIPASDGGPHMAKAGLNQYLRRHGDRFLPMEHYEVSDMFGRRPRARLAVEWSILGGRLGESERAARIQLQLKNVGRAPAGAPFLAISTDTNEARVIQMGLTRVTAHEEGLMRMAPMSDGSVAFFGVRGLILPPGPAFDVAVVELKFPISGSAAPRRIVCRTAADNSTYAEFVIEIAAEDLARVLPSRSSSG